MQKPARKYFEKSTAAKAEIARRPPKQPKAKPIPAGPQEFVYVPGPKGGQIKVNARWARKQLARRRGAERLHELGKAHKWTPEEASRASKKVWNTRWRMNKRIGKRLGRPANSKRRLDRIAIRRANYFSQTPAAGTTNYWYDGEQWWAEFGLCRRPISERTALIKLGHLKSPHGYVPPISRGTIDAQLLARQKKTNGD